MRGSNILTTSRKHNVTDQNNLLLSNQFVDDNQSMKSFNQNNNGQSVARQSMFNADEY